MGLLSKTKVAKAAKQAGDDALLLHGMLLMCGADGSIDGAEMPMLEAHFLALPEFEGRDFGTVYEQAVGIMRRFPTPLESVSALAELSSPLLKQKCYLLAADLALASGDVDDTEDAMLEAMQRTLGVEDALATKILDVLSLKYARP